MILVIDVSESLFFLMPNGSFLQCTRNITHLLWMMRSGGWKKLGRTGLSIRNSIKQESTMLKNSCVLWSKTLRN